MGIAVWALLAYVATIVVWNVVLKRNIGEAMVAGFIVVCAFAGPNFFTTAGAGIAAALTEEVVFAALAFVFMGYLLIRLGLMEQQVQILNALFGRLRGGAGYVSTAAAALLGGPSGSGSGIAASVGSVTIPWMIRTGWRPDVSASLVAGNAGLGIAIPPSSSMFLLLGSAAVVGTLTADQLFLPALIGGAWAVLYRFVVVFIWVRRYKIQRTHTDDIDPISTALRHSGTSLLVYIGILIPIALTLDFGADFLVARVGQDGADAFSVIMWIPVLTIIAVLIVAAKKLPRTARDWGGVLADMAPRYAIIGATLFFAFAAAAGLGQLGLVEQLTPILSGFDAPVIVVAAVVGILILVVAAPLTGTATIAAIGGVAFTALTAAGVAPAAAATAILIFASTEGASPPGAAPIYIASGIAGVNPAKTFIRLIVWFVIPTLALGTAIATGVLPIFA